MQFLQAVVANSMLVAVFGFTPFFLFAPADTRAKAGFNVQKAEPEVHLIVKRAGINSEIGYERIGVPADQVARRKADLLGQSSVISVERDSVSYNPAPLTTTARVSAQSLGRGDSGYSVEYNDPLFDQQHYFKAGASLNSRLSEAHGRLRFPRTVRIGIVDGGFVRSSDVRYAEGASLDYGIGPDFYNSDPGIECPNLAAGADKNIHGHWVAQVVGAQSDNGLGIAGAAKNVELVAARSMDCTSFGSLFANAESVRWLAGESISGVPDISKRVDIINMSLGAKTSCPDYLQDAIDLARSRDIPVVVAAGNETRDAMNYAPGNCTGVITIASTTPDGEVANFSNLGQNVAIAAQGSQMPALDEEGNAMVIFGTSFSTPLVAGVIASAMSDRPNLTPADIETLLMSSGKAVVAPFGSSPEVGAGIFDAMLFLDGAGIARESVTFASALVGERERYQSALTHSAAATYLQARTGTAGACDLYVVDGETLNNTNPTANDSIAVFSVAAGEPLDPTGPTASIVNSSSDTEDLVITRVELDSAANSSRQLGVAHCNLGTGINCSVKDTVKALDSNKPIAPDVCT